MTEDERSRLDLVQRLRVAVDVDGREPREYLCRLLAAAADRIEKDGAADASTDALGKARAAWKELQGTGRDSDGEHVAEENLRALLGPPEGAEGRDHAVTLPAPPPIEPCVGPCSQCENGYPPTR